MNVASPLRQCGWLLLVTLVAALVLSAPAVLIGGWLGLQGLGLSVMLCLVPGLLTVGLASSVKDQMARLWITMGGMVVRMLVILVAALAVRELQPQLGLFQFYIWLVVMYNVLLMAETWLLLPQSSNPR